MHCNENCSSCSGCARELVLTEKEIDFLKDDYCSLLKENYDFIDKARKILEINDEIKSTIKKINKVLRILSNKRIHQIKHFILFTFDIIQAILLLKSLKLSKEAKSIDFKMLRYIAYAKIGQEILRKILASAQNFCAI